MTTSVKQLLAGLAAAGLLASTPLIASAPAASAETVTQRDPSGDAAAKYDILRVTYSNNEQALKYRMKLRNIRPKHGTLAFPKFLSDPQWTRYVQVNSGARRDGTRFHALYFYGPKTSGRVRCPGMKGSVNFTTDIVTARVPQKCLARVDFAHRRYLAIGYAAIPGMSEAGDSTTPRWVAHD